MGLSPWRGWGRCPGFLVLLALLTASGCSRGTGTVTGKVTFKGKTLKAGNIAFVSSTPGVQSKSTTIDTEGNYKIENMPTGEVTITVETESINPAGKMAAPRYKPPPGQKAPEGFETGDPPAEAAKRYVWIPPKYADWQKSGLKYEVKPGSQEYNIELPEAK